MFRLITYRFLLFSDKLVNSVNLEVRLSCSFWMSSVSFFLSFGQRDYQLGWTFGSRLYQFGFSSYGSRRSVVQISAVCFQLAEDSLQSSFFCDIDSGLQKATIFVADDLTVVKCKSVVEFLLRFCCNRL